MWKISRSFNFLENQEIINLMFYKSMEKNRKMERSKKFSASCRKLFAVGVGMLIWMLLTPPDVFGQQKAKLISLKLDKVTVLEAVKEINRLSGNSISYKREELEKEIGQISLDLKDVQVVKAVETVLQGTRLAAITQGEIILIVPRKGDVDSNRKSFREKGFVYDTQKQPLPGVTVKVVGVAVGTATNEKGWFAIDLPMQKGALEFSFVGFKKKVVEFSEKMAKDSLRVVMEEDVQSLDETIVVAYGNTTRRKSSGAISVVKAEELRGIPAANVAALLQGRVAGMDVTQMSGAPGGGGTAVTIRGYNSLDVEQGRRFSDPLWVVDGVPMNSFSSPITGTNLLADLNPDMIESIQVLKDASSAAIYGSRAANGVILVTTKKGKKNQDATFTANVSYTWSMLPELPTVTTGRGERLHRLRVGRDYFRAYVDPETNRYKYPTSLREQYDYYGQGAAIDANFIVRPYDTNNGSMLQDSLNPFYNNSTNYFPIYYVKGKVMNANIQAYGGSEKMTYGIGLGYYDEKGIFRGTGFNRVDLNSSMNVKPVNRLEVDLRLNASLSNRDRTSGDGRLQSASPVETVPGDPQKLSSLLPGEGSIPWNSVLESLQGTKEKNRGVRLRTSFRLGYEPIDGLNISTSLSVDYSIDRRNYFQPSYMSSDNYSMSMGETGINLMVLNENLLSYNRTFKEEHSLDFVAGFSYQYDQTEYNGGSAQNSPSDKIYYAPSGMPDLGTQTSYGTTKVIAFQHYQSDMQEKTLLSYFARLEYGFRSKYLVSFSLRRDGSSTFGEDNRWGSFPSVAAGWTFSEEPFVRDNLGWISFGKIRASWGRSGMHFSQNYLALGVMNVGATSYRGQATIEPKWTNGLYNRNLSWEETDQYDFGLDLDLFNYRLGVTLDYYYRYTDKLLASILLPGFHNGYMAQWRNAGAISNEGIELMVKYDIFNRQDLYWKISVNGARNWNRFEKSYDGKDFSGNIIGKPLNGIYALKTDGFIGEQDERKVFYNQMGVSNYLSGFVKNAFYKPGDHKFIDVNGDGEINADDRVYCGSTLPTISGGIVNEFRWKNFDLNMLMAYSLGRHIVNYVAKKVWTDGQYALMGDLNDVSFWEKPGDHPDYPKLEAARLNANWDYVDRDVEKVNYLRLKTLTMGYSFPKKWSRKAGIDELRVFVSGENLFTWTNYSGLDPETVDITTGIDYTLNYPLARKYTLGLTLKF